MPLPEMGTGELRILEMARWPQITAAMLNTPGIIMQATNPTIPQTILAMANPDVGATDG